MLAGLALLGLLGCPESTPSAPVRDVAIVLLDALRADALGCYGARRATSPAIDAFSAEAWHLEQAYSAASYTLASVASIFTGLRPAEHRVLGLASNLLPDGIQTLAGAFADAGFKTAGFSSNPNITLAGGFGQGFESFDFYPRDRFDQHSIPAELGPDAIRWWREHGDHRRLLYVHVLPPHQPYDPPPPFSGLFGVEASSRKQALTDSMVALEDSGLALEDPDLLARLRARYDANVAYADSWFGEFLGQLDALGARQNALVVLLSDHGEGFGEHGHLLHGATPFAEMTHVPLLLRSPRWGPSSDSQLVSLVDLAATVCAQAKVHWTGGGRPLIRPGAPEPNSVPWEALSRSMGTRPLWALRTEDWTLVTQSAGEFEALFDRHVDPEELRDVSAAHPAELLALGQRLEALLDQDQQAAKARPRPRSHSSDREALEALGYSQR